MVKSKYYIKDMDCSAEEELVRMKLSDIPEIKRLEFDLDKRMLTVYHNEENPEIDKRLQELGLGCEVLGKEFIEGQDVSKQEQQRKLLWTVLIINFSFFLLEIIAGFLSNSMGLVADSLDMLADSFVYGISLLAVGASLTRKKNIAKIAGYFQALLALLGFAEVVRRFLGVAQMPEFHIMIIISTLALIANSIALVLMYKSKSKDEIHIKASLIFTSNDVVINIGVILAGILVYVIKSNIPDLIIGSIIFVVVIRGALRILNLGK